VGEAEWNVSNVILASAAEIRFSKGREIMTDKQPHEAPALEQIDAAVLVLVNLLAHQAARELASEVHPTNLKIAPCPTG